MRRKRLYQRTMKKALLVFALGMGGFSVAKAQSLELGLGGGISINMPPSGGNMPYVIDKAPANYATTLKFIRTTSGNWQYGIDLHMMELSGTSSVSYEGMRDPYVDSVGGNSKKIVYAKNAVSINLVGNRALPFSGNKNYFYIGGAFGYGVGRNDHRAYASDEGYNAPDWGRGLSYGGQVGLVLRLSDKLSLNMEAALRYFNYTYDHNFEYYASLPQLDPPTEKLNYSIMAVPVTFGIRYFFYKSDPDAVPRFQGNRPIGRALY